jgi:hypothetical protein
MTAPAQDPAIEVPTGEQVVRWIGELQPQLPANRREDQISPLI